MQLAVRIAALRVPREIALNIRLLVSAALVLGLPHAPLAAEPAFVSVELGQLTQILPSPKPADDPAVQAELAELHQIEKTRTDKQIELAKADTAEESIFIFRSVIGPALTPERLPATTKLSAHVKAVEGLNVGAAKKAFHRVRPYNADKSLNPVCNTKTKDDSYPSGHGTVGYLEALTLIDLAPERRDAILARAEEYANSRLICGVHYRSDLDASKAAAYALHALMSVNPDYIVEVQSARAELRQAIGLSQ